MTRQGIPEEIEPPTAWAGSSRRVGGGNIGIRDFGQVHASMAYLAKGVRALEQGDYTYPLKSNAGGDESGAGYPCLRGHAQHIAEERRTKTTT